MSYDIERKEIYRSELTAEEIHAVEGLDEVLHPSVTTIDWQSTGDFLLCYTEQGRTEYFHLSIAMLDAINKAKMENPV